MRKSILVICVCVLALPIIAWAQGQGQGQGDRIELTPWWDRPIVRDLGLSEGQLKQIRDIVRGSRDRLIQLRANVRIAEGHLADAMSSNGATDNDIEKVVSARGELMRATSQMSVKLRRVLTDSQWQELRKRGAQRILSQVGRRQRARAGN